MFLLLFKSFFKDRGIDSQRQKVTGLFDKEVLIVTVFLDLFTDTSNPIRATRYGSLLKAV